VVERAAHPHHQYSTASWLKDEEATSSEYWSGHLRATVRFAQAVKFAWNEATA
jgi:phthiocerol/phenolphthiocerol synthesis type-I polyketide synthase E